MTKKTKLITVHAMNDPRDELTLNLLNAIANNNSASQRKLASETGVALGLVNSYIKHCARKGYIKIRETPANRYLYYLTPKGFTEKSRLTAGYLAASFDFYRRASFSCAKLLHNAKSVGRNRVIFWGRSELAEIALIRAQETGITVIAVIDGTDRESFVGIPILEHPPAAEMFSFCIITDLKKPLKSYRRAVEQLGEDKVFVPDVLGLGKTDTSTSKSTSS